MFNFKDTMIVKVDWNKMFVVTAEQIDGTFVEVGRVDSWTEVKKILVGAHDANIPVRATPEAQRAVKRQFKI